MSQKETTQSFYDEFRKHGLILVVIYSSLSVINSCKTLELSLLPRPKYVAALSCKTQAISIDQSINQSIKTHLDSAICRERIRGYV